MYANGVINNDSSKIEKAIILEYIVFDISKEIAPKNKVTAMALFFNFFLNFLLTRGRSLVSAGAYIVIRVRLIIKTTDKNNLLN